MPRLRLDGLSFRSAVLLCTFCGIILSFSFPEPDLAPIAWVALIPLFVLVGERAPRTSAALGFFYGLGFFGALLIWIKYVGWVPWALLTILQASFLALFGAIGGTIGRRFRPALTFAALPLVWVAVEYLRANVPVVGFTWGQLAQSQHNVTHLLRIAGIGGAWGLSLLVAGVDALLAIAWVKGRQGGWAQAIPLKGLAAVLLIAPLVLPRPSAEGEPLDIAIVQGNVPRTFSGTTFQKSFEIFDSHVALTQQLAGRDVDLVVWPESAVGVDMNENEAVKVNLELAARAADAEMIVGGNLFAGEGFYKVLAFHVAPDGAIVDSYQKTHLVPFGEYVPGRRFIGWIPMLQQVQGDAVAGNEPKVFDIEAGPVAPVISFEGDFGSLVRERIGDAGGRLLVVATNTSTWDDSWASAQHVAFSKLRAAENGVWVIHAALSGISAFVAPDGTVVGASDLWTKETLVRTVRFATQPTFYARTGDWVPLTCLVASAGFLLVAYRRRGGSVA